MTKARVSPDSSASAVASSSSWMPSAGPRPAKPDMAIPMGGVMTARAIPACNAAIVASSPSPHIRARSFALLKQRLQHRRVVKELRGRLAPDELDQGVPIRPVLSCQTEIEPPRLPALFERALLRRDKVKNVQVGQPELNQAQSPQAGLRILSDRGLPVGTQVRMVDLFQQRARRLRRVRQGAAVELVGDTDAFLCG